MIASSTDRTSYPNISRRTFFIIAVGFLLNSACKNKGSDQISKFKSLEELSNFLADRKDEAYSGLSKAITLKVNPDNSSDQELKIAKLWLAKDMIDRGFITLEQAKTTTLKSNLAEAINVKLPRINDNYSPLSYAINKYLNLSTVFKDLPEKLKYLIKLIGDNHRHLPVVSADKLPNLLEEALDLKKMGTDYAKLLYATLFMISALEIGDACNQPAFCGYGGTQYTPILLKIRPQPTKNGSSPFGYYQMVEGTFQLLANKINLRTGNRPKYWQPKDQVMTAALLIHGKFLVYFKDQNQDINTAIREILAANKASDFENLARFLAQIAYPLWAALSTQKALELKTVNSVTTTARGHLFIRGLKIADYLIQKR